MFFPFSRAEALLADRSVIPRSTRNATATKGIPQIQTMFAIRKNTTARHIYILHATSICLAAATFAIYLRQLLGLHIGGDEVHTTDIFHDGLTIIIVATDADSHSYCH